MNVIGRNLKIDFENKTSAVYPQCQASFNSDGRITLRNFDRFNKSKDMIVILLQSETEAIIKLFSKMQDIYKDTIPF